MSAYDEYAMEQTQKEVSRKCYTEAKKIWDEAKEAFSESDTKEPCVISSKENTNYTFIFVKGDNDDLENLLEGADENGGRGEEVDVVVLPIHFQEWYYREPRYSDEYVRYQLGKKLEEYISNQNAGVQEKVYL